jgi:hypothetical protein
VREQFCCQIAPGLIAYQPLFSSREKYRARKIE